MILDVDCPGLILSGETNKINIEDGKTLVIKYLGLGDLNEDGTRNVQFELNGMRREIAVPDPHADVQTHTVALADPEDKSQVGASPLRTTFCRSSGKPQAGWPIMPLK